MHRLAPTLLLSLALTAACGSPEPVNVPPAPPDACEAPLVGLQIGTDSSCSSGSEHWFPLGPDEGSCHGWAGTAGDGERHENSANAIRCNSDGTFEYTQFAGNVNCEGTGVRKVYSPETCTRDIPPRLYALPIDLSCCDNPGSPNCIVDVPRAGPVGATITLDGVECPRADS
jgi:hypothetical protein